MSKDILSKIPKATAVKIAAPFCLDNIDGLDKANVDDLTKQTHKDFKIGDKVFIVRAVETAKEGWDNAWVPNMTKVMELKEVHEVAHVSSTGEGVFFTPDSQERFSTWGWPYTAIIKVE